MTGRRTIFRQVARMERGTLIWTLLRLVRKAHQHPLHFAPRRRARKRLGRDRCRSTDYLRTWRRRLRAARFLRVEIHRTRRDRATTRMLLHQVTSPDWSAARQRRLSRLSTPGANRPDTLTPAVAPRAGKGWWFVSRISYRLGCLGIECSRYKHPVPGCSVISPQRRVSQGPESVLEYRGRWPSTKINMILPYIHHRLRRQARGLAASNQRPEPPAVVILLQSIPLR